MNALYTIGPLYITVAAVGKFGKYKSGVYTPPAEDSTQSTNHAVVVIGWGTLSGKKYWLLQNSWGSGWGDEGMVKLERGSNALQIESYAATFDPDVSERTACSDSPPCLNGGAFKEDCSCECPDGYSGSTCSSCKKDCEDKQFLGEPSIGGGGRCLCACAPGYFGIDGYEECALKLFWYKKDSTDTSMHFTFTVVGIAPSEEALQVMAGDMIVATPAGTLPWTAETGWNTQVAGTICGEKKWPASLCQEKQRVILDFANAAPGEYKLYFVKWNGNNEFKQDKGYNNLFVKLYTFKFTLDLKGPCDSSCESSKCAKNGYCRGCAACQGHML